MAEQDEKEIEIQNQADDVWPYEPPSAGRSVPASTAPRYEDIWLNESFDAESPFEKAVEVESPRTHKTDEPDEAIHRTTEYDEVWLNGPPPDEFPFVPGNTGQEHAPEEFTFVPVDYVPENPAETVRQSGLAWSAGIVFFGSVAFMLFLGWIADLLFGSSPWGLVGGVVFGSVIGFVQFFRITSRIYAPKTNPHRTILSREDDQSQPPQF